MNKPIILLFGMPRSGTTWIGKIFDSHNQTLYRHEPDTWNKITQIPMLADVENYDEYCRFIASYAAEFIESRRLEVNGKLPLFKKVYASTTRHSLFKLSVLLSNLVSRLNSNVRLPIIRSFNVGSSDNYIIVWKSIQLLGRMGVISRCLDHCKGIHILRHPCGYIASVLNGESKNKFTSFVPASDDYTLYDMLLKTQLAKQYGLTIEALKSLAPEERLAWRWVLFNEKCIIDNKESNNIKVLRYEDMCADPFNITKEIFEFCGLSWCEQTNKFLIASTSKSSDSYYSVYKKPEVVSRKWKTLLTDKQINKILKIVSKSLVGDFYKN